MARRLDARSLLRSQFVRDLPLVIFGCALAALATDMFLIPNGLAAGGVTGIATIVSELAARSGATLPVGLQTIVMNALIMLLVVRAGGVRYAVQTATGFILFGVFTDVLAPFAVPLGDADLALPALWGGMISGLGFGLAFRCGVSTGGSDTIAQIVSRKLSLPMGSTVMVIDCAICAASAPVFSVANALYAALAMVVMGIVVDRVMDGGTRQRAAWVISREHEGIARDVLHVLERGCTRIEAHGCWSGERRPMLMVLLDRKEVGLLKAIVAERDRDAIVMISDVSEVLGEGFGELKSQE